MVKKILVFKGCKALAEMKLTAMRDLGRQGKIKRIGKTNIYEVYKLAGR